MTAAPSQTRRQRRPRMTAEEATHFDTFSMASALQVEEAIAERKEAGEHEECCCSAYDDVFTFNRWKAQGMSVCKGEHALRVSSYTPTEESRKERERHEREDADQTEVCKMHLRPVTLMLFCRCQVQPSKDNRPAN